MEILAVKTGALGDIIAGTAGLLAIRQAFPEARITLLGGGVSDKVCPEGTLIDHYINIDEYKGSISNYLKLFRIIRNGKFDVAVNFRFHSDISSFISWISGAKIRSGYGPWYLRWMYTHKPGIYKGKRHEFYRHTDAVAAIGKPIQEPKAFIYTSAEDKSYAETFFNEKGIDRSRTLVICPTASNYAKAWPTENYIELAKRFIQFYKGNVVITWAPNELEKVESMLAKIGEGALLTPKTTINQLAAIIAGCAVCACNNSGAMNVAMAVQAPILVFMNTSPEDWGAVGNRSISLYSSIYDERPDKKEDFLYEHQLDSETQYRLIQKITVDQAWQALQKIMAV